MFGSAETVAAYVIAFVAMALCGLVALTVAATVQRIGETRI